MKKSTHAMSNQQKLFRRPCLNSSAAGRHLLPQKHGHQSHLLLSRLNRRCLRRHRTKGQKDQPQTQSEPSRSFTELRALLEGGKTEEMRNKENIPRTTMLSSTAHAPSSSDSLKDSSRDEKVVCKGDASVSARTHHPLRRSQRLASLEKVKSIDNVVNDVSLNSDGVVALVDKMELSLSHPTLPEIENTIILDHAYSKQFDSSKIKVSTSPSNSIKHDEHQSRSYYSLHRSNIGKMSKKTTQKRHIDDGKHQRQTKKNEVELNLNDHSSKMRFSSPNSDCRSPSPASSSSGSSPWSTPPNNEDNNKKTLLHHRAVNLKARRTLVARRNQVKEDATKRRSKIINNNFKSLSESSNRRWFDDSTSQEKCCSPLEVSTSSEKIVNYSEIPRGGSNKPVWQNKKFVKEENNIVREKNGPSVEDDDLDGNKITLSSKRRGRPPKSNAEPGVSTWWQVSDDVMTFKHRCTSPDQWRRRVGGKPSSKWASLSHEQQASAVKGWTYLMQLAFSPTQVKDFWDDVEKDFFKVQVKYIRYQNQNENPVDEDYLLVLRNTVVWKHIRWHHDTITKQLRHKMRELSWRQAEQQQQQRSHHQCDRFTWMNKQMELIRCIDSILEGNGDNGHRMTSSSLTEILQTIDEVEQTAEVAFLHNYDRKMLEEILCKLQRPWSPVAVMPLGGESVSVPLPSNHELCDALLKEAHLTCLPPDVVEAYLEMLMSCSENEDTLVLKQVQYLV